MARLGAPGRIGGHRRIFCAEARRGISSGPARDVLPGELKMKNKLTHLDENGRARMVDVAAKAVTARRAVAEATIHMKPATLALITKKNAPKGDVLAVARVAGIQAAKRTHELIPLCHPLALTSVAVNFEVVNKSTLRIE